MDGIEKITGRIAQDAGREIDGILADARRQADEIAARYEAQAQRESEEIVARGRRNAGERVERLASVAQLGAARSMSSSTGMPTAAKMILVFIS